MVPDAPPNRLNTIHQTVGDTLNHAREAIDLLLEREEKLRHMGASVTGLVRETRLLRFQGPRGGAPLPDRVALGVYWLGAFVGTLLVIILIYLVL